jgi:hypothetical protein
MTTNYEFFHENAIIATEMVGFPLIEDRMFDISAFYAKVENIESGHTEIHKLMIQKIEARVLYPLKNWRSGSVILALFFDEQILNVVSNEIIMSLLEDWRDEVSTESSEQLTFGYAFFSPFELLKMICADYPYSHGQSISPWIKEGVDCRVLIPGQDWQQGRVQFHLVFYPDDITATSPSTTELSLDDIRRTMSEVN